MWVARNKDGRLFLHLTNEPYRTENEWKSGVSDDKEVVELPKNLFSNIKWEMIPVEVEIHELMKPKIKCPNCGFVFGNFEMSYQIGTERFATGYYYVACPCCRTKIRQNELKDFTIVDNPNI